MGDYMKASLGKAGRGKALRLFCAECFLASGICWGVRWWPWGWGGAPGVLGLGEALAHICSGIMSVLALSGTCPRSRFIQLGSFSDTLLVVSILDIAICRRFCSPEGVNNSSCGNYGFFLTWG